MPAVWRFRTNRVPVAYRYAGMETSDLQRLRELEAENSRMKKIVAQRALDIDAPRDLAANKMVSPRAPAWSNT
jgi:hypothetical protein